MYANMLAHDHRFREIKNVSDAQLKKLPPGAVVVFAPYNSPGNPHGHIYVTLPGGREASDHIQNRSTRGTPARVRADRLKRCEAARLMARHHREQNAGCVGDQVIRRGASPRPDPLPRGGEGDSDQTRVPKPLMTGSSAA